MSGRQASGLIVQRIRNDYTSTGVNTNAWVQLDAALDENVSHVEVFDSGGQTMKLGIGAAGSEVDVMQIPPGGNGLVPCQLPKGARLAIRAVSANVATGELVINMHR